jgi:hypothetical protein
VVGGTRTQVIVSHDFSADLLDAQDAIARKAIRRVRLIEEHGPRYPGLDCRRIQSNSDSGYHYIDVDDAYRMVIYMQGDSVLLEKLGPHDPTLRWGERASMGRYVSRLALSAGELERLRPWARREGPSEGGSPSDVPADLLDRLPNALGASDLVALGGADFLAGYIDGTIEDWMVFLAPTQRSIAERPTDGPMRIRGGPGTGKTVVALHRAKYLAEAFGSESRILVTSYVRTLPPILENLFARLPSAATPQVEFRHIVDVARELLDERGYRVDNEKARGIFADAWARDDYAGIALQAHGFDQEYVWEEIGKVVLGRVTRSSTDYLSLTRHGRRKPMQSTDRELVWRLLMAYSDRCKQANPPVRDQDSLVYQAAKAKITPRYDAIIVDEGQDLTQAGLEMLLGLLHGGPTGTLVIAGDGSQRIYPGGYRLSDSGVDIRGRSVVLRDAYRSSSGILEAIATVGRTLSPEDFGEDGLGSVDVRPVRRGPAPTICEFESNDEEFYDVVDQIQSMTEAEASATAVLLPSNAAAKDWRRRAKEIGLQANLLENYEGLPRPGVEFGTYTRAKGLEFGTVFLPQLGDDRFPTVTIDEIDRYVQQGSWLYVAMSRARDKLVISYVGSPTYLLRDVVNLEAA